MFYFPQLQTDQIFHCDVGLVFVVAHTARKCSWFNDMQVIQIMCKLLKVFQVCVNTHDSSPSEYTLISHNIKTTCLILFRTPLCRQNSSDPLRHGLHKTSESVLWYLAPRR